MRAWAALVVLCGCRGILGIHGLEDVPLDDARPPDGASPDVPADIGPDVPVNLCPGGFNQLPGGSAHRYFLETGPDVYNSQLNDCEAFSASTYLAIPDDQAELDGLGSLTGSSVWVGIDDLQTEGTYRTVKGQVASFLPFAVNEPTGNTQQNCLFLDVQGKLHDQDCSTSLPAICECEL